MTIFIIGSISDKLTKSKPYNNIIHLGMHQKSMLCTEKLRIPKPAPIGTRIITQYQSQQKEIENSMVMLARKYPQKDPCQIKQLLEELNNNVEMVDQLLQERGQKPMKQRKTNDIKSHKSLSPEEQNKILKKALASLYSKYKVAQEKLTTLEQANQKLEKEKEFYKNRTKLLTEQQFCKKFQDNLGVY